MKYKITIRARDTKKSISKKKNKRNGCDIELKKVKACVEWVEILSQ